MQLGATAAAAAIDGEIGTRRELDTRLVSRRGPVSPVASPSFPTGVHGPPLGARDPLILPSSFVKEGRSPLRSRVWLLISYCITRR